MLACLLASPPTAAPFPHSHSLLPRRTEKLAAQTVFHLCAELRHVYTDASILGFRHFPTGFKAVANWTLALRFPSLSKNLLCFSSLGRLCLTGSCPALVSWETEGYLRGGHTSPTWPPNPGPPSLGGGAPSLPSTSGLTEPFHSSDLSRRLNQDQEPHNCRGRRG